MRFYSRLGVEWPAGFALAFFTICGSVTVGTGAPSDCKSVLIFSGSIGADVLSGSASVCVCAGAATTGGPLSVAAWDPAREPKGGVFSSACGKSRGCSGEITRALDGGPGGLLRIAASRGGTTTPVVAGGPESSLRKTRLSPIAAIPAMKIATTTKTCGRHDLISLSATPATIGG